MPWTGEIDELAAATRAFVVPVLAVRGPSWQPPGLDPGNSYGLLILDGLVGRRVRVGRAVASAQTFDMGTLRLYPVT